MIAVYTDGLAEPNPGIGTYGFVIYRGKERLLVRHGFAGNPVTNNHAEYTGLAEALRELLSLKEEEIVVHSDSKLLIGQMAGDWKVSKRAYKNRAEGTYVDKYVEAKDLAGRFPKLRFEWIPREQNSEADELSRVAYREQLRKAKRR